MLSLIFLCTRQQKMLGSTKKDIWQTWRCNLVDIVRGNMIEPPKWVSNFDWYEMILFAKHIKLLQGPFGNPNLEPCIEKNCCKMPLKVVIDILIQIILLCCNKISIPPMYCMFTWVCFHFMIQKMWGVYMPTVYIYSRYVYLGSLVIGNIQVPLVP